ncbi:Arabinogalactan protein 22 [Hibiscus syriacus]|uniref:Arabinogalactan protein 22 n=1 Tax=Hibiscus syriacus TaxID=106335 RepID=A0A6A2Y7F3_HIBSY|nr:Arabinogalactan protein 22 [Hibiscus syriacus]
MEKASAQPVCAQEALELLNCVTQSPFDQDKCLRLLHSLRDCVLKQKVNKFSLDDQDNHQHDTDSVTKKN